MMLRPPVRGTPILGRLPGLAAFAAGASLGGLATLVVAHVLGGLVAWVPFGVRVGAIAAAGVVVLAQALGVGAVPVPQRRAMIPIGRFDRRAGAAQFLFGLELGSGLRTYLPSLAPHLVAAFALAHVVPLWGLPVLALGGSGSGVTARDGRASTAGERADGSERPGGRSGERAELVPARARLRVRRRLPAVGGGGGVDLRRRGPGRGRRGRGDDPRLRARGGGGADPGLARLGHPGGPEPLRLPCPPAGTRPAVAAPGGPAGCLGGRRRGRRTGHPRGAAGAAGGAADVDRPALLRRHARRRDRRRAGYVGVGREELTAQGARQPGQAAGTRGVRTRR